MILTPKTEVRFAETVARSETAPPKKSFKVYRKPVPQLTLDEIKAAESQPMRRIESNRNLKTLSRSTSAGPPVKALPAPMERVERMEPVEYLKPRPQNPISKTLNRISRLWSDEKKD